MENIRDLLFTANKSLASADHLAFVTFPSLKELKLLISITENLYISVTSAMNALLEYERLYKRVMSLPKDFDSRLYVFKTKCAKRYNLKREFIQLIDDLHHIISKRKSSVMEFSRGDKYILASSDFRTHMISYPKVKDYVGLTKELIKQINNILGKVITR